MHQEVCDNDRCSMDTIGVFVSLVPQLLKAHFVDAVVHLGVS